MDRDKARGAKANSAVAARSSKPPSSAWTTSGIGKRGQRAVAPVASTTIPAHITLAPGPRPISAAAHLTSDALRLDIPETCARQGEAPGDANNRTSIRAAQPGVHKEANPADATHCNLTAPLADEVGCTPLHSPAQHPCPEPNSGAARESERRVVTLIQVIITIPKMTHIKVPPSGKPYCARVPVCKGPGAGRSSTRCALAMIGFLICTAKIRLMFAAVVQPCLQVTALQGIVLRLSLPQEIPSVPTLPAKPLLLVNRMTPGTTSGSAQWKPLTTASGRSDVLQIVSMCTSSAVGSRLGCNSSTAPKVVHLERHECSLNLSS